MKSRLTYIDNFRIYLTILVIFHHASIAYGGNGGWGVHDPAVDEISPIFLTFFNAVNQSYFMSAFFLMAGYFTPRAFEKKGAKSFLADRFIRLGVPLLVYTTVFMNINAYLLNVRMNGGSFIPWWGYEPGHLWFVQALLLFALVYAAGQLLGKGRAPRTLFAGQFPKDKALAISIVFLAAGTFAARLAFPVGETVVGMQPAHFVHYIFSFTAGVLAYRSGWFEHLDAAQAKRWGWGALAAMPFFFILAIAGGVLESEANLVFFMGGPTWQSLAYSIWESFMMIAILVFLLSFFQRHVNQANPQLKWAAASVFTVYIVHQTVLYYFNITFLPVAVPTIVKFFVTGTLATLACFVLSLPLRRLPMAHRVLG